MSSATSLYDCNVNHTGNAVNNFLNGTENRLTLNMHTAIFSTYLLPLKNVLLLLIWPLQKLDKVFSS